MIALSVLYAASFIARDAFGIRQTLPEREPYALGFDGTLSRNLLTYLGWTANFILPTVRTFADVVDPPVFGYGIAVALLWLLGLASQDLRARGWLAAGALYLAMLLPVLPLRNHTYHYYLYGPLLGAAWGVALLADFDAGRALAWLRPRRLVAGEPVAGASGASGRRERPGPVPDSRRTGTAWVPVAMLGAGLTVNGLLLVRSVETHPVVVHSPAIGADIVLRRDPTVDRAIIAANVSQDLARARLSDGVRLLFWSPDAVALQRSSGQDTTRETYFEQNVRIALLDGLAVRVLFPRLAGAEFVRVSRALGRSEADAIYRFDGHVRVIDRLNTAQSQGNR